MLAGILVMAWKTLLYRQLSGGRSRWTRLNWVGG